MWERKGGKDGKEKENGGRGVLGEGKGGKERRKKIREEVKGGKKEVGGEGRKGMSCVSRSRGRNETKQGERKGVGVEVEGEGEGRSLGYSELIRGVIRQEGGEGRGG